MDVPPDDPGALPHGAGSTPTTGDRRWPAAPVFVAGAALSVAAAFFSGGGYVAVTAAALLLVTALAGRRRRPLAFALGWLLPPAAVFAFLLWHTGAVGDYFLSRSFDRGAWLEARGATFDDRSRLRMVDDLQSSGRLRGLTKEECVAVLGEPDGRRWGDDDASWVWRLGPSRGFPIDSSWLQVRFAPDGRVESTHVVED